MVSAGTRVYRRRICGPALISLLLLLALGCGNGSTPLQPSSAVQVKIGDATADRVVAVEMTLTSLVLTRSDGQQVSVLPEARRIEFTRLAGTVEPVALLNIPQGSYTEAALAGSNLHLTYLDANGAVQEYTQTREITTSMVLNPQLGVTTSSVINVDLNLAASILSIDPTNVAPPQFRPVYTFSISPVYATQQQEEEGALEHVIGVVTAADSSSFTMQLGQNGILLTFAVDASTAFQDVTLTTLPNMIVEVDGITAADGSLHAERVAGLTNTNGAVVEGMLFNEDTLEAGMVTRSLRRTTAELVVQDGVGNGMVSTLVGTPLAVDFANASYGINGEGMPDGWAFDLIGGLVFNAATIFPGQEVQIVSDTGITPLAGGYTMPARTVTLQEQAASGAVSDYRDGLLFGIELFSARKTVSPRSVLSLPVGAFDLVLPEDSYLHLLTLFTSVTVGIFPQTKIYGTNALSNLMNVRVRGWLLYFDEELFMIADRIDFVSAPVPTSARMSTPRR
jgi:Domain of unknown function (DUF5666)